MPAKYPKLDVVDLGHQLFDSGDLDHFRREGALPRLRLTVEEILLRCDALPFTEGGCQEWSKSDYPSCGKHSVGKLILERKLGKEVRLFILHNCDNSRCVNPEHLYEGTQLQNMRDRLARGKYARGNKHPLRKNPELAARGDANGSRLFPERLSRGSNRYNARLTEVDVVVIRQKYARGGTSIMKLAREYSVGFCAIQRVTSRTGWKHVP